MKIVAHIALIHTTVLHNFFSVSSGNTVYRNVHVWTHIIYTVWVDCYLLWNHLNTWGPIFVNCSFFWVIGRDVNSWMCRFSVSALKLTLSKFVFVKDVNSFGRASHKYHENWTTMNSNDSMHSMWSVQLLDIF